MMGGKGLTDREGEYIFSFEKKRGFLFDVFMNQQKLVERVRKIAGQVEVVDRPLV